MLKKINKYGLPLNLSKKFKQNSLNFKFNKLFSSKNIRSETYDYIIVGGGSAGCVLANRLTEDPNKNVLLIEAGDTDINRWDSWKIQMPSALTYNLENTKYNWEYLTESQSELSGRKLIWPRGKVLGGSSSLNAMAYVRGNAMDFERWETQAPGWAYKNCLPYFKKAQTHQLGGNEYRGGSGPLHVSRGGNKNPLYDAFLNAGVECGYNYNEDSNGYKQEGFGPMEATIRDGVRSNTANAYLRNITNRPNLTIKTKTYVKRVIFDGKTATGIEICSGDISDYNTISKSASKIIHADGEVILSGGALNSPQLLLLSGIGNSEDLAKHNIPVVHHSPEVGRNLQDHLEVYLQYKAKNPVSIYEYTTWRHPLKRIGAGINWFYNGGGVCGTNHFEVGAFFRSNKGIEFPDIQLHFFPAAVAEQRDILQSHAYQVHCGTLRPHSRGELKLVSDNPFDRVAIQPNLIEDKRDLEDLCNGIRLTVEVLEAKAFEKERGEPLNFTYEMIREQDLLEKFVRDNCESAYHCSGTCAMGKVTETDGRVKGVEGLRVCDASVMPYVTSGNTNSPTVMLAEKIADMIKGECLPESTSEFYVAENWRTHQR